MQRGADGKTEATKVSKQKRAPIRSAGGAIFGGAAAAECWFYLYAAELSVVGGAAECLAADETRRDDPPHVGSSDGRGG